MQTVVRCPHCGNAWDADERPEACEVCQGATEVHDRVPGAAQRDREAFWEAIDGLLRGL